MRTLAFLALIAFVPVPAIAQCKGDVAADKGAIQMIAIHVESSEPVMSVADRNAATMKAALGGDDSHSTDADLN